MLIYVRVSFKLEKVRKLCISLVPRESLVYSRGWRKNISYRRLQTCKIQQLVIPKTNDPTSELIKLHNGNFFLTVYHFTFSGLAIQNFNFFFMYLKELPLLKFHLSY